MFRIFILFICFCFLYLSKEFVPENNKGTNNVEQVVQSLDNERAINIDTAHLKDGDYRILIITKFVKDSLNNESPVWFYPLILNQEVILSYKDKTVYNEIHKVKKISIISANHHSFNILENAIVEIGIINGDKNKFFSIEGYGGCNSCPEYRQILNKKGESIYLSYHDQNKIYIQQGILMDVLKLNGIDQKKYRKGEFLKKRIEPL